MSQYLLVLYVLLAVAFATPISLTSCGKLDKPFSTYKLAGDIVVKDDTKVCFDIIGKGITLDGNGFELSSPSSSVLPAIGVQYSGEGVTVTNLHITNIRTGIHAKGKFGFVYNNKITRGTNGIDISATNNRISNNIISHFHTTEESTSGIYVYFPAVAPVDSNVNITNNVIFDISGDDFAQGISVYYANSVHVGRNRIYDIKGAIMGQNIAVIRGGVDEFENEFTAPPSVISLTSVASLALTAVIILASLVVLRSPSTLPRVSNLVKEEKEIKQEELLAQQKNEELKMMKEKERAEMGAHDEFDADGADVMKGRKFQSFSLSSSVSLLSSPIM